MIFRTLLFLLVLYLLIKVISRLFLSSSDRQSSSGYFYRHFSGGSDNKSRGQNRGGRSQLDEIEEAEYEDVTEEESETRKNAD